MNMMERGRRFVHWVNRLTGRSVWEWRQCPRCGSEWTIQYGSYTRKPWTLAGRR